MAGDRVFAAEQPDGAFDRFAVEEEVVVHQVALYGIPAPHPPVTLDAVDEELTGRQVHGIGTDVPDAVQFLVATPERAAILLREILVEHADTVVCEVSIRSDKHIAEGFAPFKRVDRTATGQFAEGEVSDMLGCKFQLVESLAMFGVECLFRTFAVIDVHEASPLGVVDDEVTEGFASEVVEYASVCLLLCHGRLRPQAQAEFRGACPRVVEVPVGSIHVGSSRSIAGLAAFVYPLLVLVGHLPRAVRVYRLPIDKQGRRSGLVPHLDVQMVCPCREMEAIRHTKLQLAVELDVELAFSRDIDVLRFCQFQLLTKFHSHVVAIHLPERGKECSTLGAATIHLIAQPYFIVTGIPYPCTFTFLRHIFLLLFVPMFFRVSWVSISFRPTATPSARLS